MAALGNVSNHTAQAVSRLTGSPLFSSVNVCFYTGVCLPSAWMVQETFSVWCFLLTHTPFHALEPPPPSPPISSHQALPLSKGLQTLFGKFWPGQPSGNMEARPVMSPPWNVNNPFQCKAGRGESSCLDPEPLARCLLEFPIPAPTHENLPAKLPGPNGNSSGRPPGRCTVIDSSGYGCLPLQ